MIKKIVYGNNFMLTKFIVFALILCVSGGMQYVFADKQVAYNKSFISIEINDGDTLTSIAEQYAVSDSEYRSYIEEVKYMNNLKSDTIHTGCYLMIPVYTPVQP